MTLASRKQSWDPQRARTLIQELQDLPGALMPILHAFHEEFGYVDKEVYNDLAEALNLSRAEVVGVVSFYHDFRETPPGRHVLKVCRAESCQAMGGEALAAHVEGRLGVEFGETTPDEALTLEPVYCLGNCALSPAVMLDGRLYGRVSTATADRLIDGARSDS